MKGQIKPKFYNNKKDCSFNNKSIYLFDVENNSYIRFNSQKECMKFLNVKGSSYIGTYKDSDKIIKNKYKIISYMPE